MYKIIEEFFQNKRGNCLFKTNPNKTLETTEETSGETITKNLKNFSGRFVESFIENKQNPEEQNSEHNPYKKNIDD